MSDKPRTSAFARMQMALEGNAPNAYHASVAIPEPWHRTLFTLLDGSRDRKQLAIDLTELSWQEICRAAKSKDGEAIRVAAEFADNPQYASSREALLEFFEERLPGALDKLLRDAYLL
ncbi:MAG: hypothetical protein U5J83_15575 [Bryobacterales bacterium]|nr:hypothetical protein [Bryobacterales bacterium]